METKYTAKAPKVSIIVPVYNVEKYLEECVESLRSQTLKDIEIILVDDESPDNCPTLCDHYAQIDSRIKVIHKKNGGLGFARNSGIEVATGVYIAFTDSDDYELPETYETLYNCATANEYDVLYYRFIKEIDIADDVVCTYERLEDINGLILDMVGNPPEKLRERDIQVSSCLGLYRRDLLEANHIRFHSEREIISEDLVFNIDVLTHVGKLAVTNYGFYFYRVNGGSLSRTIRLDRHEKNKFFYFYLRDLLQKCGFGYDGWLRSTRLFIGYSRSTILQLCRSTLSYKEKRKRTIDIATDEVWEEIHNKYPYRKLPWKYRLFFEMMCHRFFFPLWLMSKVS